MRIRSRTMTCRHGLLQPDRPCHGAADSPMLASQARTEATMTRVVRALAGLLLAAGLSTAASAQTKWDMPTPYPDGNFHTKNVAMFAADVAKATNGALTIAVHSAGSLFKHAEIKRSVRQGTAPIGEILESLASNEAAVYGLDSVPFLATGYAASKKLYDAQRRYLEKQLASEGLIFLYSVPWPPQGL